MYGIVHINSDDLFTFSSVAHTRGHDYKLYKPRCVSSVRRNFFIEKIINVWNFLPHAVDFSSLLKFKRSLNRVDFSGRFYGMRSRSCSSCSSSCFMSSVFVFFLSFYGQNVSASFLCLSCPALVLVLTVFASSCLSK